MKNLLRCLLCLLVLLCSCTKDSGDSNSNDNQVSFSGSWYGTVRKIEDTCYGLPDPVEIDFIHVVQHFANDNISLRITGGDRHVGDDLIHNGSTLSDDEFLVSADVSEQFGNVCTVIQAFEYAGIRGDDASVTRTLSKTCSDDYTECFAKYVGSATRSY